MQTILLSFFLCLSATTVPPLDDHLINWKQGRKLQWSDFQGKPDVSSENAALTSTHINFQYTIGEKDFSFQVSCQFNKHQSWVRVKDQSILAHEQAHFDLAELYSRKLKWALQHYKFRAGEAEKDLDSIYENIMAEHHAAQTYYDQETDHSRNRDQQLSWQKKIQADLTVKNFQDLAGH
jgi:predicted secreted Zn-dependent protease